MIWQNAYHQINIHQISTLDSLNSRECPSRESESGGVGQSRKSRAADKGKFIRKRARVSSLTTDSSASDVKSELYLPPGLDSDDLVEEMAERIRSLTPLQLEEPDIIDRDTSLKVVSGRIEEICDYVIKCNTT